VLISALGIPIHGVREVAKARQNPTDLKKTISELLIINIISGAILSVVYFLIICLIPALKKDLQFYAVGGIILMLNFCNVDWLFSGLEKFRLIALRSFGIKLISLVLLFCFVKKSTDDIKYLWITVISLVLGNIWNLYSGRKLLFGKLMLLNFKKHFKPLSLIFFTVAAVQVYTLLDTIILGFLTSYKDVGYYTAAYKLSKISIPVLISLGVVLIPRITLAFEQNNISEAQRLCEHSFEFMLLAGIPISVGLVVFAPGFIHIFSGKDFSEAILPMQILSPVVLIIGISNVWAMQILTPAGKDRQVTISVLSGVVVSVILNFILIPFMSYNGAAITNVLSELIVMICFAYFSNKIMRLKINYRSALYTLIAAFCFYPVKIITSYYLHAELAATCVGVFLSAALYFFLQSLLFKNSIIVEQFERLKNKLFQWAQI
jgi:O-antigen/teichoic acid export membrane protein